MSTLKDSPYFMIHGAVTITAPYVDHVLHRFNPMRKQMEPYVPQLGEDKEVCQFAAEFTDRCVSEKKFRAAMAQLTEAMIERARTAGLVVE